MLAVDASLLLQLNMQEPSGSLCKCVGLEKNTKDAVVVCWTTSVSGPAYTENTIWDFPRAWHGGFRHGFQNC